MFSHPTEVPGGGVNGGDTVAAVVVQGRITMFVRGNDSRIWYDNEGDYGVRAT